MSFSGIKFLILISLSYTFAQRNRNKKCAKDEFDKNIANIFGQFGHEELKFPESRRQLNEYCKISKASNEYAKLYGQTCLTSTSQTLMSLFVYNFERTNKQYCAKNGKLKDEFVEWAKCGNNAKTKMLKCWDKMLLVMANTKKVKNSKSKIPIICCNYYEWTKCTIKEMKEMGSATCPQNSVDGYDQHIKKASVDAMNLICKRYEDNDEKCNSLYEQLPKTKPANLRKTPLLYIFDVFDSL